MTETFFAVEILEPFVSKWMFIELAHASRIVGRDRLWVFNVRRECEAEVLASIASRVERMSIVSLGEELSKEFNTLVLDPSASQPLSPRDFTGRTLVVVGGIMGDHPPRGRTRRELTEKLTGRCLERSIGRGQFTIDGAIYVAYKVSRGATLEELSVRNGLRLKHGDVEVYLPYSYPVERGSVVISEEEVRYILEELEEDEARATREGKLPSVC
ncbi:hypothetical protein IG193_05955 [Infirmifilum lucidum]|uniref:Uncharacterized protein n=1 Tax=Infirmifilum lucidum TaxID=2776706 RepID=A0A7L9FET0_9CREN|nr:hypothetical protein [Infirmifilum lucidum]QOJ78308.1 hypothetical protein IG193_05955 [Infirmifilum lucidum]